MKSKGQRTKLFHDMFHIVHLGACSDKRLHLLDWAFDCPGNLVDVLRLDNGLQIIFEDFGKVI